MECSNCPFKHNKRPDEPKPKAKEMKFFNEGVVMTAKMKPVNDAFYEITEGKYRGNLVHVFDIIRN